MSYTVDSEIGVSEDQAVFEIRIASSDGKPLTLQEVYDAFVDSLFTYYGDVAVGITRRPGPKQDN
jgi:hypothetical protein